MGAIRVTELKGAERDRLLTLDEDTFVDLKSLRIAPKKLSVSLSALANASGGDLYIGIEEVISGRSKIRRWDGFADIESANGHIQALESIFPLGSDYLISFLSAPGSTGLVLNISIQRTTQIVLATNGKAYIRRGAQNLEVKGNSLSRLELDKGIQSFENRTVDIELDTLYESETMVGFIRHVVPNVSPDVFLKRQHLVKEGKPTVSAVLLFSDEPQAALPKRSGIKLYRYKTTDAANREFMAFDPISIEGPIYSLIKQSVDRSVAIIEDIQKLGPAGLEPITYPIETLHEIVTNAVLHRDYSIAADVLIRIFDNRIEVESPGILPGHVTIKNILDEQFARNGVMVRLINKFPDPPNKDVGEGMNTAFNAMHKIRLKPPTVQEENNCVLVTIRHESLASPEEMVMDYLSNHDEITNKIARAVTGIASENSMKDVFIRLANRKLLQRVPDKHGAASAWMKHDEG